jgi:1-acyl-sn-glycerol-3-phosphate acyltransferase
MAPRSQGCSRAGPCTIAGRPVDLSQWAGQQNSAKALRAATEAIMTEVTALLGQLRGQTPPEVPYTPKN